MLKKNIALMISLTTIIGASTPKVTFAKTHTNIENEILHNTTTKTLADGTNQMKFKTDNGVIEYNTEKNNNITKTIVKYPDGTTNEFKYDEVTQLIYMDNEIVGNTEITEYDINNTTSTTNVEINGRSYPAVKAASYKINISKNLSGMADSFTVASFILAIAGVTALLFPVTAPALAGKIATVFGHTIGIAGITSFFAGNWTFDRYRTRDLIQGQYMYRYQNSKLYLTFRGKTLSDSFTAIGPWFYATQPS
jgi:hypothetical protein